MRRQLKQVAGLRYVDLADRLRVINTYLVSDREFMHSRARGLSKPGPICACWMNGSRQLNILRTHVVQASIFGLTWNLCGSHPKLIRSRLPISLNFIGSIVVPGCGLWNVMFPCVLMKLKADPPAAVAEKPASAMACRNCVQRTLEAVPLSEGNIWAKTLMLSCFSKIGSSSKSLSSALDLSASISRASRLTSRLSLTCWLRAAFAFVYFLVRGWFWASLASLHTPWG
jgi:hypothetical protein